MANKNQQSEHDELLRVMAEIHDRGGALVTAFADLREEELLELMPDLKALRDSQDATLEALKHLRKTELDNIQ